MTATLPPYSGETARCTKCGNTSARTRYQARLDPSARIQHEIRNVSVRDPEQERLCRDCERCHFHWDEATVDADAEESVLTPPAQIAKGLAELYNHWSWNRSWQPEREPVLHDLYAVLVDGRAASCSVPAEETEPNNQETP